MLTAEVPDGEVGVGMLSVGKGTSKSLGITNVKGSLATVARSWCLGKTGHGV